MFDTFHSLHSRTCLRRLSRTQVLLRELRVAPLTLNVPCKVVRHAEVERRRLEFNLPSRKFSPFVPRRVNPTHEVEVVNVVKRTKVRALEEVALSVRL